MTLKFKKPEIKEQRLKAMFYGEMGTGKSTCACQFPATAYIDTEDTASKSKYAKMIIDNGGQVLSTGDFDEILSQVKELGTTKHDFKTLVIDSLTIPYENLLIECERLKGSDFGRHVAMADQKMKQFVNLLLRIDLNIIVTCQAKKEYAGGRDMQVVGQTYAGYKRLGYMFDLVFETQIRGNEFFAVTKKSRIENFPMNETFNFSYDEVVKRYGSAILERENNPINLASEGEVKKLKDLINLLKIPEEMYQKWLDKAEAETFEEMNSEIVNKCIEHLKDKIKGEAA